MLKKCLFRGGLCLVNTAVIAISTPSVVVAEGIEDAINTLGQISWRLEACRIIEETKAKVAMGKIKGTPWVIENKYDKSIKQVIGKALADCVTNRHEFKDKEAKDLITFKGSIISDYDQTNWNAVLLYNYVNRAIKGAEGTTQQILANCVNELQSYYLTNVQWLKINDFSSVHNGLMRAFYDIGEYVKQFNLIMESKISNTNKLPMKGLQNAYSDYNYKMKSNHVQLFHKLNQNHCLVEKYSSEAKPLSWWRFAPFFGFENNKFSIYSVFEDTYYVSKNNEKKQYEFARINYVNYWHEKDILASINRLDLHLFDGLEISFCNDTNKIANIEMQKKKSLAY